MREAARRRFTIRGAAIALVAASLFIPTLGITGPLGVGRAAAAQGYVLLVDPYFPLLGGQSHGFIQPVTAADGRNYYLFTVRVETTGSATTNYVFQNISPAEISLLAEPYGKTSASAPVGVGNTFGIAGDPTTVLVTLPASYVDTPSLQVEGFANLPSLAATGYYNPLKDNLPPLAADLLDGVPAPLAVNQSGMGIFAFSVGLSVMSAANGTAYTVRAIPHEPFLEATNITATPPAGAGAPAVFPVEYARAEIDEGPVSGNPVGVVATIPATRFSFSARASYGSPVAEFILCQTGGPPCQVSLSQESAGVSVTANGTYSYSPGGEPLSYTWNFGDGTSAFEAVSTHVWHAAQIFDVNLTVRDPEGRTGSLVEPLDILAVPPVVHLYVTPSTAYRGEYIELSGQATSVDSHIVSYTWYMDNNPAAWGINNPVMIFMPHTFPLGNHTVILYATDAYGITGGGTASVDIIDIKPFAFGAPNKTAFLLGTPTYFTDKSFDPNGFPLASDVWNFGDNTSASESGPYVSHVYAAPGQYRPVVTVTDSAGNSNSFATPPVVVEGTPPTISTALPSMHNGWFNTSAVLMHVSVADQFDPSPTLRAVVDSANATPAGGSLTISGDGVHAVGLTARNWVALHSYDNLTVRIDHTPPSISFTPIPIASGQDRVAMGATDATSGVAEYVLTADGQVVGRAFVGAPSYAFIWDTTKVANGLHTLTLTVFDTAGNSATQSAQVLVVNA